MDGRTVAGMGRLEDWRTAAQLVRSAVVGAVRTPAARGLNPGSSLETSSSQALEWARAARWTDLERAQFDVPEGEVAARAFWINLYNALTVHAVHAAGVKSSVTAQRGFFDRFAYTVSGFAFSLNDIEHGVLRGNRAAFLRGAPFKPQNPRLGFVLPLDPRVHFALNCGARSCPPIRFYSAEHLDAQLDLATTAQLQDVRLEGNVVWLPRLMSYYAADFGEPLAFTRRYRPDLPATARVKFLPYDWGLETAAFADHEPAREP